jgi:hypothetical protein
MRCPNHLLESAVVVVSPWWEQEVLYTKITCLYQQQLLNWTNKVLHNKSNEKHEMILGIVGLILRNMNITLRFEENREKQRPSRLLSEVNNNLMTSSTSLFVMIMELKSFLCAKQAGLF